MPPRAKITKEMIVDAAFAVARASGMENINARTVSQRLGCSTQPVLWHFKTIADIKKAAYEKADRFHTESVLNMHGGDPMKDIGLNYIRFAATEKNLFRFIFQSDSLQKSHCLLLYFFLDLLLCLSDRNQFFLLVTSTEHIFKFDHTILFLCLINVLTS